MFVTRRYDFFGNIIEIAAYLCKFLAGERLRFKKLVVSKIIPIFAKKDIDICRKI